MSICIGQGVTDKMRRLSAAEYMEDLERMAEKYRDRDAVGECFVHVRSRNSSNRDLRALSELTHGARFHRVNLKGKFEESIITNVSRLASLIVNPACGSTEDVVREMEKEIRGNDWVEKKRFCATHVGRIQGERGMEVRSIREKGKLQKLQ